MIPKTPTGKLIISLIASLAEFDRESILERTRAGQKAAKAKGIQIGRHKGVNEEQFAKVKRALEKELSVAETVNLTGISLSSVKRYKKLLKKT